MCASAPLAGGGGFGDPLKREPERVLRDVVEEKVARAGAERDYGVIVVDGPDGIAIDHGATQATRKAMRLAADSTSAR